MESLRVNSETEIDAILFAPARSDNIPKCLASHSVNAADQTFTFCSGQLKASLCPRQKRIIVNNKL